MNKQLQIFLASVGCISALSLTAQPTLTNSNTNPVLGETFVIKNGNYVSPGNAGANQTWNLSGITASGTNNYTVVNASSTPNSSSFPGANISLSNNSEYIYWNTTSGAIQNFGTFAGGVAIPFSNPEDMMHFPFTFNNSYTDTWNGTFVNNSITFYRTGTTTVTADGYGTVTTPAGTFNNALRVHFVQDYQDSANVGGPLLFDYVNDEYMWYLPGVHYPIAAVYSFTAMGSASSSGFYLNNVTTGLNESFSSLNYKLFPNPASNRITIEGLTDDSEVRILNVIGGEEKQFIREKSGIEISALTPGIYFVVIEEKGIVLRKERVVVIK